MERGPLAVSFPVNRCLSSALGAPAEGPQILDGEPQGAPLHVLKDAEAQKQIERDKERGPQRGPRCFAVPMKEAPVGPLSCRCEASLLYLKGGPLWPTLP